MGPTDAGADLQKLLADLAAKGWKPAQVEAARERWEDVCHDPMRRGRGGRGLPENEPAPAGPAPLSPIKPDAQELISRTVSWPADGVEGQPPTN
ncbi:MAG TPA: hypothetical protein VFW71_15745 [Actinomycetota bacterium]|nr:hypothetical protein [Actinomycetota bacterium]